MTRLIRTGVCVAALSLAMLPAAVSADILFSTVSGERGVQDRGYPVMGEESSQVEFGFPWWTVPAFLFSIDLKGPAIVDSIDIHAFGTRHVTGAVGDPHNVILHLYGDASGEPGAVLHSQGVEIDTLEAYRIVLSPPVSLSPGNYWLGLAPEYPDTRAGWARSAHHDGVIVKSLDGGATWEPPYVDHDAPAVVVYGHLDTTIVPTLTEWGLIALTAAMLISIMWAFLRRRAHVRARPGI